MDRTGNHIKLLVRLTNPSWETILYRVSAGLASKVWRALSSRLSFKDVCICIVNSLERQRSHCTPEQRTDVLIAHYQTFRILKLRVPLPLTKPTACTCINLDSSMSLIPMGCGSKDGAMENMLLLMLLARQPVSNKFFAFDPGVSCPAGSNLRSSQFLTVCYFSLWTADISLTKPDKTGQFISS